MRVQVGPPIEIGQVGRGRRRIVPILGGTCEGRERFHDLLTGRVLPGGADWQLIHDDGLTEADARYTIETDRGSLVYVQNRGLRHAPPDVMKKLLAGESVDPSLGTSARRPRSRRPLRNCRRSRATSSSAPGNVTRPKW